MVSTERLCDSGRDLSGFFVFKINFKAEWLRYDHLLIYLTPTDDRERH